MDSAELLEEQPRPTPNGSLSVQEMVLADIQARMQVGLERYGVLLQPNNGRDALRDAYEEAIDLAMYLRQAIAERDARVTRCTDCHRPAGELKPWVEDGQVVAWLGPTCFTYREDAAGVQLPIGDRP
jgi:hypothetical protein